MYFNRTGVTREWNTDDTERKDFQDHFCRKYILAYPFDLFKPWSLRKYITRMTRRECTENNVAALQMAFTLRGIENYDHSLVHHSDKGTQYASDAYMEKLETYAIRISMCN